MILERAADGPACTSVRGKTHVTEALEVLYPWHPWFGRAVYFHEVIEHGGKLIFRCDLGEKQTARCINVPAWMFDRSPCLRIWGGRYASGRTGGADLFKSFAC